MHTGAGQLNGQFISQWPVKAQEMALSAFWLHQR
jgi:hypothetical protein